MYKFYGLDEAGRILVVRATPSAQKTHPDIGSIIHFEENDGFAIICANVSFKTPEPVANSINEVNLEAMQSYMPESRDKFLCRWVFHRVGGELALGNPPQMPPLFTNAHHWDGTQSLDFAKFIKSYLAVVLENNILVGHLNYLLTMPSYVYAYNLIIETLKYGINNHQNNLIYMVDTILEKNEFYEQLLAYRAENVHHLGSVVAVNNGIVSSTSYQMPNTGDVYKFPTNKGTLFGSVSTVGFSYEHLDISNRTRKIMSEDVIPAKFDVQPLVSMSHDDRLDRSVRSFPVYGEKSTPIEKEDIQKLFPGEAKIGSYSGYEINFDPEKLFRRSVGIFGKSGTGKSFVARVIAAQAIRFDQAILIFDEHNEFAKTHIAAYGNQLYGLQDLFPDKVKTISFGDSTFTTPDGTKHQADHAIKVPVSLFTEEDICQVGAAIRLPGNAPKAISAVRRKLQGDWAGKFNSLVEALLFMDDEQMDEITESSSSSSAHISTLTSVRSSLGHIFLQDETNFYNHFTVQNNQNVGHNTVSAIIDWLKKGYSIILNANLGIGYTLVANMLFRLITSEWKENPNRHLTIFLEEAHRLIPVDNETIVGTVAREMRKYKTTLLVIDQMPGQIDRDVLTQIGTYVIFPLLQSQAQYVMPENVSASSILSQLSTQGEAYVHGDAFVVPLILRVADFPEIAEQILTERQQKAPSTVSAYSQKGGGIL